METLQIRSASRPVNLPVGTAFRLCQPVPIMTVSWTEKSKTRQRHEVLVQIMDQNLEPGEPTLVFIRGWEWEELQKELLATKKDPFHPGFDPEDLESWAAMVVEEGRVKVFRDQ